MSYLCGYGSLCAAIMQNIFQVTIIEFKFHKMVIVIMS